MSLSRSRHRTVACVVVIVELVFAWPLLDLGGREAWRSAGLLIVVGGIVWFTAAGFDRRYPSADWTALTLRFTFLAITLGLALVVFADPWVFGASAVVTALAAVVGLGWLGTATLYYLRSQPTQAEPEPAPAPDSKQATPQRHLILAALMAVPALFVGLIIAVVAGFCSSTDTGSYVGLILTPLGAGALIAVGWWMDRRWPGRADWATSTGRLLLVAIVILAIELFVVALFQTGGGCESTMSLPLAR